MLGAWAWLMPLWLDLYIPQMMIKLLLCTRHIYETMELLLNLSHDFFLETRRRYSEYCGLTDKQMYTYRSIQISNKRYQINEFCLYDVCESCVRTLKLKGTSKDEII